MKSEFDAMWSRKGGKEDVCRTLSRMVCGSVEPYAEVEKYMTQTKSQLLAFWEYAHKVRREQLKSVEIDEAATSEQM